MRDPDFDNLLVGDEKPTTGRGHGRKLFWAFVGLVGIWLLSSSPRRFTCAACRLDRVEYSFSVLKWSIYHESECCRWYAENVEPTHSHVWASCARCESFGIPLVYGGVACYRGKPISQISKSVQVKVYEKFRDPIAAKRLCVSLAKWSLENQRLMEGLEEWAVWGGPETWDEWWPKHRQN